jgi:hypothetical protein
MAVLSAGSLTGAAAVRVPKAIARPTRGEVNFIVMVVPEMRGSIGFEGMWWIFGKGKEQMLEAEFL